MRLIILLFILLDATLGISFGQKALLSLPYGHNSEVIKSLFSKNGNLLASLSYDGTVIIWRVEESKPIKTLTSGNQIKNILFKPNTSQLLGFGGSTFIQIWDIESRLSTHVLQVHSNVEAASFSPDGKYFVVVTERGEITVYSSTKFTIISKTEEVEESDEGYETDNVQICFIDNSRFIVNDNNYEAEVYNLKSEILQRIELPELSGTSRTNFQVSNGGKFIVANSTNFDDFKKVTTTIWDAKNYKLLKKLQDSTTVSNELFFDTFHDEFYDVCSKAIKIYQTGTWKLIREVNLSSTPGRTNKISFCSNKRNFLVTSQSNVLVYDREKIDSPLQVLHSDAWVNDLSMSPDNELIATSSDDFSITLWDFTAGKKVMSLKGHNAWSYYNEFHVNGETVLSLTSDGSKKLWDIKSGTITAQLAEEFESHSIIKPRFSPDGNLILHMKRDDQVQLLDFKSQKVQFEACHNKEISVAEFDKTGQHFLTVGEDSLLKLWEIKTNQVIWSYKSRSHIQQGGFTTADIYVYSLSDSLGTYKIDIMDASNGHVISHFNPWDAGIGRPITAIYPMPDNESIAIVANGWTHIVNFLTQKKSKVIEEEFDEMIFSSDGKFVLTDSYGSTKLWTGNFLNQLSEWKRNTRSDSHPIGFSFNSKFALIPENNSLIVFDLIQSKKIFSLNHDDEIIHATFSKNDSLIVTSSIDNSLKVWNSKNGRNYYTFFFLDSTDYVVVDSVGRFDGTINGRSLVYYLCGNSVIELSQLKKFSWEPGLVSKIMGVSRYPFIAKGVNELNICNYLPTVKARGVTDGLYTFDISERKGGIGQMVLFINGKQIKTYEPTRPSNNTNNYQIKIKYEDIKDFLLVNDENKLTVRASTKDGYLQSKSASQTIGRKYGQHTKPNLFCISIGVSKYVGEELNKLTFPPADANDISKIVSASAKRLLNDPDTNRVFSYTLITDTSKKYTWPLKENIRKTFDEVSKLAKPDDIVLVFMAGHGVLSTDKQFYFLTPEAVKFELGDLEKQRMAISTEELNLWLRSIKAQKQILILDACNSGQVIQGLNLNPSRALPPDQQRVLENLADMTGIYMLAASASGQNAYEMSLYGQGVLTYSLLKGVASGAALYENRFLDISSWFNYAMNEVKDLSKDVGERQDPQILTNGSIQIGLVDDSIIKTIALSEPKPLFRKSTFVNIDQNIDDSAIGEHVDSLLYEEHFKGKSGMLAFQAESKTQSTYSLSGTYSIRNSMIIIRFGLFKGVKSVKNFEITEQLTNLRQLYDRIYSAAISVL